jgi:transposase
VITVIRQTNQSHKIIVGIEPTGIYHEAWVYAIEKDFGECADLYFLNPYQVMKRRLELHNGRKRKSDTLDVKAIASCLRDRLGVTTHIRKAEEMRLELWATAYRQNAIEKARLATKLLNQVDRLWQGAIINTNAFKKAHPDLEAPESLLVSKPLERKLLRSILSNRPNPYQWLGKSPDQIQESLKSLGYRCNSPIAGRVFQVINNAMLPPPEIAELLAERLSLDFQRYLTLETEIEKLRKETDRIVAASPAAILTTIPGINSFLAARYLAYIVDANRFHHADEIWAFAGYDVCYKSSGDHNQIGKISKHGDPAFRETLFQIGLFTSHHCIGIQKARERALANGKGRIGAILHAAHKANRICYRLLVDKVPFDPKLCE